MDRGFAGVVAVAVLGCAVILAIAFQISEGLAMEGELRGGLLEIAQPADEQPAGGLPKIAETALAVADEAAAWESGMGLAAGAVVNPAETTPADSSEMDLPPGLALAASGLGTRPVAEKGMPATAGEINPAEGHTVSPRTADEIGEPRQVDLKRGNERAGMPSMTASDRDSSTALDGPAPNATLGGVAEAATPAIEMIRGTRRTTESIAASGKED